MRSEELLDIIREHPFTPYRFTFTGGETHDLIHPEMMILGRSLVTFTRPTTTEAPTANNVFHVSLLHIIKVERISSAKSQNGKKNK